MNIPRLILAIVAGFIVIFATDFLIHGVWLVPDYKATESLWRPESEMQSRFHWLLFAQILCAVTFVIIWAKGAAGTSMGTAIGFGVLMGLFQQIWAIVNYVVIPMPGALAAKWFFSGVVQAVLLAVITALIYKPALPLTRQTP
jgi:hypothetical protein